MTPEASAAVGFTLAGATAAVTTPFAVSVAQMTDFYDRPRGYRQHALPTPLLGGAAILGAFLPAALVVGAAGKGFGTLLVCGLGLWVIGTLDDRVAVAPRWRVATAVAVACALYAAGVRWSTGISDVGDFVLTVLWVVGIVNAFNLMDNLDGACGTVGLGSALGIGFLAVLHEQPVVAGVAFALAGACAGFLRWNLAAPAKIFLGDGGSMPLGLLIAGLAMAAVGHGSFAGGSLLEAAMLVGLPILDVTLVTISRLRRGVTPLTGGRDHLTHRLLPALGTPRRVAGALAVAQVALCALAIVGDQLDATALGAVSILTFALGVAAIVVLDSTRWRPAEVAVGRTPGLRTAVASERRRSRSDTRLARAGRARS